MVNGETKRKKKGPINPRTSTPAIPGITFNTPTTTLPFPPGKTPTGGKNTGDFGDPTLQTRDPNAPGRLPPPPPRKPGSQGRPVGFIERAGEQFVVPAREFRELQRIGKTGGETLLTQAQERQALEEGQQRDIRAAAFEEQEGVQGFIDELGNLIANPPDLAPESVGDTAGGIVEDVATFGLRPAEAISSALGGTGQAEEFATTKLGKAIGLTTAGVAAALVGARLLPIAARAAASGRILGSAKTGTKLLGTAATGLGVFLVGRSVFDFRGDEMDVMRKGIQRVVEDGERIEAATRNGLPSEDSIETLRTMADEIAFAERRIKELGNKNLQYRVSKEYQDDFKLARSGRESLQRRALAIQNIAATGQASLNPSELMFQAEGAR